MFETLDDFIEEARKEVTMTKNDTMFLSVLRLQDPNTNILSAQIHMQFKKDNDFYCYMYTDKLPSVHRFM